jgi:hypothetical protein
MRNGRTRDFCKKQKSYAVIENGGRTEKSKKRKGERQT